MNFKKIICLMLVVMMALTVLMACRKVEDTPDTDGESQSTQGGDDLGSESETESKPNDEDTLGEYNFNGAEYKILTRKATRYEFDDQNEKGLDSVNNAIYLRNESVQSRFSVKFRFEETNGSWDSDFVKVYEQKATVGWSDVSLTSAHFAMQQLASLQGFCRDMTTLKTEDGAMDMTKEWWSKPFYESCNIEGKFYVAVGDITYTMYEYMQVVFFNENLAKDYVKDAAGGEVNLYELVKEEEWTYDLYQGFIKAVSYNDVDQIHGLGTQGHAIRGYATAFEAFYTERDDSGAYTKYSFPEVAPERVSTVADTVSAFMKPLLGKGIVFNTSGYGADEAALNQLFAEGKLLFYEQMLGEVVAFNKLVSDTEFSFGVLPLPMWDDDQLEYHTPIRDTASAVSVPKNVQDLEMAGVIPEALCMYSYQNVRPEYLDTVLSGRYMDNPDMQYVLDIVRSTFTVDFAHAYSGCLGTPYSMMDAGVRSTTDQQFSSTWAKSWEGYQAKLVDLYQKLGVSAT